MTAKKTLTKLVAGLALLYSLNTAVAQESDNSTPLDRTPIVKVHTETSVNDKGVPLQRSQLNIGDITIKYDIKTNLQSGDNNSNVGSIFLDNILNSENTNLRVGYLVVGNHDINDEHFLDVYTSQNTSIAKLGLELGMSSRKTADPRKYFVATVENLKAIPGIKATLEGGMLTKDVLQSQDKNQVYVWSAINNDDAFISVGYAAGDKQVFAGMNNNQDFGYFGWYKHCVDGSWSIKNRMSLDDVDKKFFSSDNDLSITRTFVVPAFFEPHLNPSHTRGNYTLGVDLKRDSEDLTTTIVPGIKTGIGSFGAGAEIKGHDAGIVASYYTNVSLFGANASIELNFNGRTKEPTAYITLEKSF